MFHSPILICWAYKSALSYFGLLQKNNGRNMGASPPKMKEQEFEVDSVYSHQEFCHLGFFHIYVFIYWVLLLVFHLSLLFCLYCCPPRKISSESLILIKQSPWILNSFKSILVFIKTTLSKCIMSYMYLSSLS